MPGGKRGERPSRRSPWLTSTITAGSVRGKCRAHRTGSAGVAALAGLGGGAADRRRAMPAVPVRQGAGIGGRRRIVGRQEQRDAAQLDQPARRGGCSPTSQANQATPSRSPGRCCPASARPSSASIGACRTGVSSGPSIGTMSSHSRPPASPGRCAPAPASRGHAADARRGRGHWRHRPAMAGWVAWGGPLAREAAAIAQAGSACTLALPGRTADIRPRKAGDGRGPRQPGQVRKEAAVTSFAPGRRPAFRLARPSGRWSRSCSARRLPGPRPRLPPHPAFGADRPGSARPHAQECLRLRVGSPTPSCSRAFAASARPRPPASRPRAELHRT